MVQSSIFRKAMLVVAASVVAAVALGWFVTHGGSNRPGPDRPAPAFRECADEVGITWQMHFLPNEQGETFKINLYDHGCGLAVGDFDGDGKDDIYFCNQLGKNALYRNKGDGTFEEVAQKAGVALGDRVCVAAAFVDYDNDGRQDLFVTSTRGGNVMFRNKGDGTFEDVTAQVGLTHVGHSQTAVFFDYDNDGFLDLFLTNTAAWTVNDFDAPSHYYPGRGEFGDLIFSRKEDNILYHNEPVDPTDPSKGRKFVNVTAKAGLKGRGWAGDAVAFDYDGDGLPDLFVTSMFGRCQLYHNNGDGTFTDTTLAVLGRTPFGGVGTRVFDYNNDGRLDLFAVDMHSDMWMGKDEGHTWEAEARRSEKKKFEYLFGPLALINPEKINIEEDLGRKAGFQHDELIFGNAFWRNEGSGKFTEVSDAAGLETLWPWGIATGDFTNSGWEDVFIASGMGYPFWYWPNYLLMNQGDGTFQDRAEELGIEPPRRGQALGKKIADQVAVRSSRCAVTGDFRGDGRLDIVVNNFNDQPYYFKNVSPRSNYVAFRLRGRKCNRDAVGAVVRLYQGDKIMTRQVLAGGGYLSQCSKTLHFGLGDQPRIDRVEITWPGRSRPQQLKNFDANTVNPVDESEEDEP